MQASSRTALSAMTYSGGTGPVLLATVVGPARARPGRRAHIALFCMAGFGGNHIDMARLVWPLTGETKGDL